MTWHWRSSCGCICRLGKWPSSFEYNRIRWKWVSFGLLYPELIFHLVHLSHFQFPTDHQLPALDILSWVGPFTALGCMVGGLLFKHATNRIDFSALLTDPVQPEDDGSVGRLFCLSVCLTCNMPCNQQVDEIYFEATLQLHRMKGESLNDHILCNIPIPSVHPLESWVESHYTLSIFSPEDSVHLSKHPPPFDCVSVRLSIYLSDGLNWRWWSQGRPWNNNTNKNSGLAATGRSITLMVSHTMRLQLPHPSVSCAIACGATGP